MLQKKLYLSVRGYLVLVLRNSTSALLSRSFPAWLPISPSLSAMRPQGVACLRNTEILVQHWLQEGGWCATTGGRERTGDGVVTAPHCTTPQSGCSFRSTFLSHYCPVQLVGSRPVQIHSGVRFTNKGFWTDYSNVKFCSKGLLVHHRAHLNHN